jgi:hypothetical protein
MKVRMAGRAVQENLPVCGAGPPGDRTPRKRPPLVAASTRSSPGAVVLPGVEAGSRASLKTPSPSNTAMPASGSHGSAPPAKVTGPLADSTPRPASAGRIGARLNPCNSPVPTMTKSSAALASNLTMRQPQDCALLTPPRTADRSAQPPTGDQNCPASSVYQRPPFALAA